jgi:hypothetical protein
MSGDCFDHVWNRVEYDCLERLMEYMNDGLVNFNFENINDYKFMLHNLFEGYYKIAEANIWMKRLDWYLGCDDGEEAFQEHLKKELTALGKQRREKDTRCFDCEKMCKQGCSLKKNRGKTITLTDNACSEFVPIDWTNYIVNGIT